MLPQSRLVSSFDRLSLGLVTARSLAAAFGSRAAAAAFCLADRPNLPGVNHPPFRA